MFGRDQKMLYLFFFLLLCSLASNHFVIFSHKEQTGDTIHISSACFWSVKKRGCPVPDDVTFQYDLHWNVKYRKTCPNQRYFFFQFMFSKHALPLFIGRPHFYKTFLNLCSCQQCPKHAQWDKRKPLNHSSLTFTGTHTCKAGCEGSKFVRVCVWSENIANSTLVHQRTSLPWRRVRRIPGRESDHMLQQVTGGGSSQEP